MTPSAVLVTGASSGIGEASARRLAADGYRVYAGVRDDNAKRRLSAYEGVVPLDLDVTDPAAIVAAKHYIRDDLDGSGLVGVVNNAGIAIASPVELLNLEDFRQLLEVNVIGLVAVTQQLLPLLRAGNGRVVNMSSPGGRYSGPILGPYAASKHAVEALSDALRIETRRQPVRVVLIEPGEVATPVWEKTYRQWQRPFSDADRKRYGPLLRGVEQRVVRRGPAGMPAERVAAVVAHALTTPRPRARYPVGWGARVLAPLARLSPDRLRDGVMDFMLRH